MSKLVAHTFPLLPSCCCYWQTDVCWCFREWESERYSVIESLLPLCTSLPLSYCGYNLSESISVLKAGCSVATFDCLLSYMSHYLALSLFPPCPLHFFQKMCSYRLLATFVSIPVLNHHFPHCVHVWMAPQQVRLLYASSLFIVFLCVWLTCHPQKMFASPRHCRLDTLVRSQPGLPLKRDRQFGSGLFIGSRTCSHSGDYVLISCLTQGDQSLSSCTLSPTFVWKVSDWWGVSNQRQVR